jgi:hypothetical protein
LDEAIVPYPGGFSRSGLIIDDELHAIFDTVDTDVNLSVILDSCHSGTGIREPATPNATLYRRFPASLHVKALADAGILQAPSGRKFGTTTGNHVLLAACAPTETAADGTGSNGLYTSHLLRAMAEDVTYTTIHANSAPGVKRASNNRQNPQIEGNGAGRKAFACLSSEPRWF